MILFLSLFLINVGCGLFLGSIFYRYGTLDLYTTILQLNKVSSYLSSSHDFLVFYYIQDTCVT